MKLNSKGTSMVTVLFTAMLLISVTSSIFSTTIIRTERSGDMAAETISEVNSNGIIDAAVNEIDYAFNTIDYINKTHFEIDTQIIPMLLNIEDEFNVTITDITDPEVTYVKYARTYLVEYFDYDVNTRYFTEVYVSLSPDTTGEDAFLNYAVASNNDLILNGGAYFEGSVAAMDDIYITDYAPYRADTNLRLDSIPGVPDYNHGFLFQYTDFPTVESTYMAAVGGNKYGCAYPTACYAIDTTARTITPQNFTTLGDYDISSYMSVEYPSMFSEAVSSEIFYRFDLEKVIVDRINTAANTSATFTILEIPTILPTLFNDYLFNMPNKNYFETSRTLPNSYYIATNENSIIQLGNDKANVTIDTDIYWLILGIDTYIYSGENYTVQILGKVIIDGDLYISGNVQIMGSIFVTGDIIIGAYDYARANAATTNYWIEYIPTTLTNVTGNSTAMALFAYGDMKWYNINRFDDISTYSGLIYSDDPASYSPLTRGYFYAEHNNIIQGGAASIINIEGGVYAGGIDDTYVRVFEYDNTVDFPNTYMDYNTTAGVIINAYRGQTDDSGGGPFLFTSGNYQESRISIHANQSMYPFIPGFPALEAYGFGSGVANGVQVVAGSTYKADIT